MTSTRRHRPTLLLIPGARKLVAAEARDARLAAAAVLTRQDPRSPLQPAEVHALAAGLERQGATARSVLVAAPADKLITLEVEAPAPKPGLDLHAIAHDEAARLLNRSPDSFTSRSIDIPPPTRAVGSTRLVAALEHDAADELARTLDACRLTTEAIVPLTIIPPPARQPHAGGPTHSTAVHAAARTARFTLCSGNNTLYERALTEAALHPPDQPTPHPFDRYADTLAGAIDQSLAYAERRFGIEPPDTILLSGEAADLPGLPQALQDRLGLDVTFPPSEHTHTLTPPHIHPADAAVLETLLQVLVNQPQARQAAPAA